MAKNTYQYAADIVLNQHHKELFPLVSEMFKALTELPQDLGNELTILFESFASNDTQSHFSFDLPFVTFVVCSNFIDEDNKKPITSQIEPHELATKENLKAAKIADRKLFKIFEKMNKTLTLSENVKINITNIKVKIELAVTICGHCYTKKYTHYDYNKNK